MSSVLMIVRTLSEIALALAIVAGFVRENKFMRAEKKAFRFLRALHRKTKEVRRRELEKELLRAQYADEYETDRSSKPAAREKDEPDEQKKKNHHSRVA